MVTNKSGDLLTAPVQVICHCCNLHHVMGAGIAARIQKEFPEAYSADCATEKGSLKKLGTVSWAKSNGKIIFNMYAMIGFKRQDNPRPVSYEYFYRCLETIAHKVKVNQDKTNCKISIGFPKNIACTLAGGSWTVIEAMIQDVFGGPEFDCYIYDYNP